MPTNTVKTGSGSRDKRETASRQLSKPCSEDGDGNEEKAELTCLQVQVPHRDINGAHIQAGKKGRFSIQAATSFHKRGGKKIKRETESNFLSEVHIQGKKG